MTDSHRTRSDGEDVLAEAVESARLIWQDRLVAAYALGSLAHGGFSAVSDIDVGLVLHDPLLTADGSRVAELTKSVKASNRLFSDRLSVFWGSIDSLSGTSSAGRFPPLDRLDLKKYGRLPGRETSAATMPLSSISRPRPGRPPPPTWRAWLQWRDAGPQPADADAVAAIAAGILPLYPEFLLDHEPRLREYERPELADSFHEWREKLKA